MFHTTMGATMRSRALTLINTKLANTVCLRNNMVRSIKVARQGMTHIVEVPDPGSTFPQANSKCGNGVRRDEIAWATRTDSRAYHPDNHGKGGDVHEGERVRVDLTPPYVSSFQPIKLFWQHGKQCISFDWIEISTKPGSTFSWVGMGIPVGWDNRVGGRPLTAARWSRMPSGRRTSG